MTVKKEGGWRDYLMTLCGGGVGWTKYTLLPDDGGQEGGWRDYAS